jgi:glycine cleavage system T protein
MTSGNVAGEFIYDAPEAPARGSVLYEHHLRLAPKSRLAPFAGYLMPLWYSSIGAEHEAVRSKAGMFDCTHMGVLEVAGPDAQRFLYEVSTNDLTRLENGKAQYGYILDAAGKVLDDIIVYRRAADKFMVVVNAANEAKIKAYFAAILGGKAPADVTDPKRVVSARPLIRDTRDVSSGSDCRCDIAVQGPASLAIVASLVDQATSGMLSELKPFGFVQGSIAGIDCIIARTGYTGAKVGFELFVHPDKAGRLWDTLLESGKAHGLVPCGLGARDSLRVEAGLPLYGHELDGEFEISPFEAGYGWAVKTGKTFFVGKGPMALDESAHKRHVVRLSVSAAPGIRPVRMHDGVLDADGKCLGAVLSCAKAGENQVALAIVIRDSLKENDSVGIYYAARNARQVEEGRKEKPSAGDRLAGDIGGKVLSRFEKF